MVVISPRFDRTRRWQHSVSRVWITQVNGKYRQPRILLTALRSYLYDSEAVKKLLNSADRACDSLFDRIIGIDRDLKCCGQRVGFGG
jgi:hypothetical protein